MTDSNSANASGSRGSRPGRYPGPLAHAPAGSGPGTALYTVRRHKWLILFLTVVVLVPVAYTVLTQKPSYEATGLIRIVDARGAITGALGAPAADENIGPRSDVLLSRLEVLRGRSVMGRVVDNTGLRLYLSPELSRRYVADVAIGSGAAPAELKLRFFEERFTVTRGGEEITGSYGAPLRIDEVEFTLLSRPAVDETTIYVISRDAAIDALTGDLKADIRPNTDAVLIRYSDLDPYTAQLVVNGVIDEFQAADAAAARESARRRRIFHEQQLESTEGSLVVALTALSDFRGRTQSYTSREAITAQQQALLTFEAQRQESDADRQMYETLLARLQQQPEQRESIIRTLVSSPGIASNAVVAQLYSQLVQYQAQRASLTSGSQASTASHPDVARLDALIASTQESVVAAVQSHVSSLRSRVAALEGLRGRSSAEMTSLPRREVEEAHLVQQVESLQKLSDQLRDALQNARMAEQLEFGQVEVVHAAPLPTRPVPSNRNLKLAAGLIVGLGIGFSAAFARDAVNTSMRRREDVEELLQIPNLATIPHVSGGQNRRRIPWGRTRRGTNGSQDAGGGSANLLPVPTGIAAESYRVLRNNLLFAANGEGTRTLMVTSALPGEGKTLTAVNLSIAVAQQGRRVLLVDCDLHRGRVHEMFSFRKVPGLGEVLSAAAPLSAAIRSTPVDGLAVLPCGAGSDEIRELMGSDRMRAVLEKVSDMFDLVILDAPPVLAVSETALLGRQADGVLMVVRAGQTNQGAAEAAARQLAASDSNVLGAVMNDPAGWLPAHEHYYGYYAAQV
jgi:polysaccharide biosynthesis transport protein